MRLRRTLLSLCVQPMLHEGVQGLRAPYAGLKLLIMDLDDDNR